MSRLLAKRGLPGLARAAGSSSYAERVRGAVMLYEDIAAQTFFVLDSCPLLAESMPLLTRDPDYPEDVLKTDAMSDDIFDALKHAVLSVATDWAEPPETKIAAQAAAIEDPLAKWLSLTKAKSRKQRVTYTPNTTGSPLWEARQPRRSQPSASSANLVPCWAGVRT